MTDTFSANDLIDFHLQQFNESLAKHTSSDVLMIRSPMYSGLDDRVRQTVEKLCQSSGRAKKQKLTVLLETNGGFVEVVERIHNVFRKHYKEVDFIVPGYAYSAGTVLVLSGDNIFMDYYSVLGPIDPQVPDENGKFVPGMGYLHMYEELVEKSKKNNITQAELLFLTKRFEPAFMFQIQQAKSHAADLIKEWLPKYKFKHWKTTKSKKQKVTPAMKKERADDIAEILGDAKHWHSHGRGIPMRELTSSKIKLEIEDFGSDSELNRQVRQYYDLFLDYGARTGAQYALHSRLGMRRIGDG